MSLRRRLEAVERMAGTGIRRGPPPCPTCGAPSLESLPIVQVGFDEDLRHCEECGQPVDASGAGIGQLQPDGDVVRVVLRLNRGPAWTKREGG